MQVYVCMYVCMCGVKVTHGTNCVNLDCEKAHVSVHDSAFQRTLLGDLHEALPETVFVQQVRITRKTIVGF